MFYSLRDPNLIIYVPDKDKSNRKVNVAVTYLRK